ncbi:translation initiation factor IF-2-like [Acinonyx jubatus]|uniref:Translation initiation factor IF-2-like n=1 Tax=Acinonyx jubatus TaxID=32536 RepID=A0ABM3NQC9_ACIJB|nr:translation initiation factor IF-2-like [Acinonyx jubatus]
MGGRRVGGGEERGGGGGKAGWGPGTAGPEEAEEGQGRAFYPPPRQRREEGLQVGRSAGCKPRRPCGEGQQNAARPGYPRSPGCGTRSPRAPEAARLRSAGLRRRLVRAAASPLADAQPPPHAAPGPGAPRRPREPSAGEGGVPASGERAPTPAPATASCPPGRKGGNRSNITAARPGSGAPAGAAPPLRPRTPGVERPGDSRCGQSRGPEEEEAGRRRSRVWIAGGGGPERAGKRRKTGTGGRTRTPLRAPRSGSKLQAALPGHRRKPGGPHPPSLLPSPETPRLLIGWRRTARSNLPPPCAATWAAAASCVTAAPASPGTPRCSGLRDWS